MIYILSLFFIWTWYRPYDKTVIDPILKPYYLEYKKIVDEYCTSDQYITQDFKLVFDEIKPKYQGICNNFPNAFKITVNKRSWNYIDEDMKFALIAHEFSHCQFEVPHFENPFHYMYYAATPLSKSEVISQLKEILIYKCK